MERSLHSVALAVKWYVVRLLSGVTDFEGRP